MGEAPVHFFSELGVAVLHGFSELGVAVLHGFSELGVAVLHCFSHLGKSPLRFFSVEDEVGASASVEIEHQGDDYPQQGKNGLVHEVLLI